MALTIGRKEHVDLPDLNLRRVKAKVDTGARTSSLGVVKLKFRGTETGPVVEVIVRRHEKGKRRRRTLPVMETCFVKSSSGETECRPVVELIARLGGVEKRIRVTLSDRSTMRHVMLLGRSALAGDF